MGDVVKWGLYFPYLVRSILIWTEHPETLYCNSCNAKWQGEYEFDMADITYIVESKFLIWSEWKNNCWSYWCSRVILLVKSGDGQELGEIPEYFNVDHADNGRWWAVQSGYYKQENRKKYEENMSNRMNWMWSVSSI